MISKFETDIKNTIYNVYINMDASLNIVALMESTPIARLSYTYNNKFLTKIKDNFNETQQQLFVSSFYCYLNHHSTNDYVIDLDNIWQWLGFKQKVNAKTLLEKHFKLDIDYKKLLLFQQKQDGADNNDEKRHGGTNKETFLLNIKTFKYLCIKAGTNKASEIHEYFIKLEELLHEIVQEETDELKLQLQQTELALQQQQEENSLMQLSRKVPTIYIYNTDTQVQYQPLLKIGITHCIADRIKPYKTTHPRGKVIFHQEVEEGINIKTVEHSIHNKLAPFKIQGEMFRIDVVEAITCVRLEYASYKMFQNTNESERKHQLKQTHELTNRLIEHPHVTEVLRQIHTCDSSTQTDFNEMDPATTPLILDNTEVVSKFDAFVRDHCIVRSDVQVSAKLIIGQYRILAKEAKKEVTQSLTDYLKRRFVYGRLRDQDQGSIILGYSGVMLKPVTYVKSTDYTDAETFVFEKCRFTPAGTVLYKDMWKAYQEWKRSMHKPVDDDTDERELKKYLKSSPYLLFETVWSTNGGGQGFYGMTLKSEDTRPRVVPTTGCIIVKKDANDHVLGEYSTIAKAAEQEEMGAAKMSRSIKHKVMFGGTEEIPSYYYAKKG